jgi:predicted amidohydrolase YtcJ
MHRFFGLMLVLFSFGCAHKQKKADLVVHNATIYLVDEDFRTAKAMAITDGIIVEIGAEREILNKYRADEFIDAAGRAIIPALYSNDPLVDLQRMLEGAKGYPMEIKEAILTLSLWEARESMEEDTRGCLRTGLRADFIILNGDPVAGTPFNKVDIGAIFTEGKQVFP